MSDCPGVELDFRVHWCSKHLEPFRAGWPGKVGVAMTMVFDAVVADPVFFERMPKTSAGLAMASALDSALREHSPLCCWLGDVRMGFIYAHCRVELR